MLELSFRIFDRLKQEEQEGIRLRYRPKDWEAEKRLIDNTPGTRGGPGGRDRTLAVKRRKNA